MLNLFKQKELNIWKPIPEWEDIYEVNEFGEVRNIKTNHMIVGDINSAGYARVALYRNGKCVKRYFRHRLVALLFLPNPHQYPEVNHIDKNKKNNHVDNLEWCTRIHNEHHSKKGDPFFHKPFFVIYNDGHKVFYDFVPQLAQEINVTPRTVQNYLQKKSKNYIAHNIKEINYV